MQVTAEWMQMMARYNAWQNGWVVEAASGLSDDARRLDRGGFFGSIQGTLSHLLWADLLWMSRFDGGEDPVVGIPESVTLFADWQDFRTQRLATDRRIENWTKGLDGDFSAGDLTWFSGAMQRNVTRNRGVLFTHFFNHQTHHRGQVHAMLTSAGAKTSDTDLAFLE